MDNKKAKEQYHDYKAHDLFKCENLVDFMRRYSCAHEGRLGCSICDNCENCLEYKLKTMGYCKADEVRKETAKEILQELIDIMNAKCDDINADELNIMAKKYGVEVDE